MSQLHLSDEILMAFADGELDEPIAAAVAKAMAEEPGIAKRVVDFQQSRRLTRSAYSKALATDVPPALHAAVLAQIKAYETADAPPATPAPVGAKNDQSGRRYSFAKMALAASFAVLAVALGFFAGRQTGGGAGGVLAQLNDPLIRHELGRAEAGREVQLPIGRLRVISTYRLANGALCREFRLRAESEAADAVACRTDDWNVTFALSRPASGTDYIPSSASDPMAAYLQSIGAGEPLVEGAEAKALAEASR